MKSGIQVETVSPKKEEARVSAGPAGVHWQNGIYFVPTSEVDGRKRWETIIGLLCRKKPDDDLRKFRLALKLPEKSVSDPC
jgi:hypothetical protein